MLLQLFSTLFILIRLDYCNSVLAKVPDRTGALQSVVCTFTAPVKQLNSQNGATEMENNMTKALKRHYINVEIHTNGQEFNLCPGRQLVS